MPSEGVAYSQRAKRVEKKVIERSHSGLEECHFRLEQLRPNRCADREQLRENNYARLACDNLQCLRMRPVWSSFLDAQTVCEHFRRDLLCKGLNTCLWLAPLATPW